MPAHIRLQDLLHNMLWAAKQLAQQCQHQLRMHCQAPVHKCGLHVEFVSLKKADDVLSDLQVDTMGISGMVTGALHLLPLLLLPQVT